MDDISEEFNKQLELDVLVNGLTEITSEYVDKFDRHSLTDVVIPEGVKSIGAEAFSECWDLMNITIPDSVTSIGDVAFRWCISLTNLTIGKGVTKIGLNAFSYCRNLKTVTIPDSVVKIGSDAFYDCYSTNIMFKGKTLDYVHSMDGYPWGIDNPVHVQVS